MKPSVRKAGLLLAATITAGSLMFTPAAMAAGASSATAANPFNFLQQFPQATPTVTTPAAPLSTSATSNSGSISSFDGVLIGIAAAVLLVLVCLLIWRDARRQARAIGIATGRRKGSKAPQKNRKLSSAERKRRKRGQARGRRG